MGYQDAEKRALSPARLPNELHHDDEDLGPRAFSRKSRFSAYTLAALLLASWLWLSPPSWPSLLQNIKPQVQTPKQCPQVAPLIPRTTPALDEMDRGLLTEAFTNASIKRLSSAVQIPTESFDDMGPLEEDRRWDIFFDFADHLRSIFPLIHSHLKLEMVNTHGLLYTWQGEDPAKKPLLLMAHQDVVPVPKATVGSWTHGPFSGFFDGDYIWGRGASDCKNQLIAVMESVEELLGAGFKPSRSVLLSFGFDEEISGREGAGHLAPFILDRYGHDGIAAIVDEGAGFTSQFGSIFATPGVGEKGYTDVDYVLRMPGGHSSIPPPHTSIGVLSELITHIEGDTYRTWLADNNPFLAAMQCGAAHAPKFPKSLKKLLPKPGKNHNNAHDCSQTKKKTKPDPLAEAAAKLSPAIRYLMQTSIAADVIQGGVKVNALPERAQVTVNHRINIGETIDVVKTKSTKLARAVADKYNLTLYAFDDDAIDAQNSLTLTLSPNTLAVAPVTPTEITPLSPYAILAGTTRALYSEEQDIIVSPGIMTGNTDTRYYWDLSKHIFRWNPGWVPGEEGLGNIHTVDERISVKAHVNAVRWFSWFVRNMDEAGLE